MVSFDSTIGEMLYYRCPKCGKRSYIPLILRDMLIKCCHCGHLFFLKGADNAGS